MSREMFCIKHKAFISHPDGYIENLGCEICLNEAQIKIKQLEERGYLGWANGWGEMPDIVKNCKHKRQEFSIGDFQWLWVCEECGFWYKVDTSG